MKHPCSNEVQLYALGCHFDPLFILKWSRWYYGAMWWYCGSNTSKKHKWSQSWAFASSWGNGKEYEHPCTNEIPPYVYNWQVDSFLSWNGQGGIVVLWGDILVFTPLRSPDRVIEQPCHLSTGHGKEYGPPLQQWGAACSHTHTVIILANSELKWSRQHYGALGWHHGS